MPKTSNTESIISARPAELDYREGIERAVLYLEEHLDEPVTLADLAATAGFSPFHFHRIFHAFMGCTAGDYTRRLRMRRAAFKLVHSSLPVIQVALDAGFQNTAAFSRAFRRFFGIRPTQMRSSSAPMRAYPSPHLLILPIGRLFMKPEIRTLPDLEIYYVRRTGTIARNFNRAADLAFTELTRYAREQNLTGKIASCLGICPDDPDEIPPEECRYDAGYIFQEGIHPEPKGEVKIQTFPAGRWAVFTHHGPYEMLWQTWRGIYSDWLPSSGEKLRDVVPFEVYVNDKRSTAPGNLITEIYVAIM